MVQVDEEVGDSVLRHEKEIRHIENQASSASGSDVQARSTVMTAQVYWLTAAKDEVFLLSRCLQEADVDAVGIQDILVPSQGVTAKDVSLMSQGVLFFSQHSPKLRENFRRRLLIAGEEATVTD